MRKDLLTTLSFFSLLSLVTYIEKPLKSSRRLRILLVLVLSIFYTTSKAQITHSVPVSNPSFPLPAGINEVTVEAWGAGGAGGGALFGGGNGRSGAGGTGGTYAQGKITGINTQTLNVVVAKATAGGPGNGAAGEASYITGFTSVFYAPGGKGGGGNPATGPTPPAVTATTGAIGSMTTANGGASGAGSTTLLGLLLSSGKGGDAGNLGTNMGGAGGLGFISVLGANDPGNPGRDYGGGGAGAASTSSVQNGGAGARGQVNITYTCKPYSITGISASNVCTGTTTQVVLTGTAASLPAGTYTVTYSKSLPSTTGQTETMVVNTAGSGSFTARGLTNLGNCTITVTSLTSVDCTSPITANNVANIIVSAQPTIALGATTAVCASASLQNVALPYTAVTNAPTRYSITWNANPANSFLPVTNAILPATPISIAVPAGTSAGTYTGSLTVSNAAGCVSATATNFTITVNPLPTITLGATTAVCTSSSAQSTTLPYTAVSNSPTNYSITWNTSPTNTFATVSNAILPASPINIPIPANTAAGTYTGILTVSNANGCVSAANNFTVTVNGPPTITLGTTTPVCFSAAAQTANLNYTAVSNSPTSYSITWNASPTNSFAPVSNAILTSSPISISVPAGTNVGTYTGILTVRNANGCVSAANNFTITVNPLPTITLGATTAVCTSSSAQSTTLPYTAVSNSPTNYSISWNANPTNTFATVSNAVLPASPINIPIPANTAAGTYTGTLTVSNANGCVSAANNFTVTVNPLPTITLGVATAVCTSTNAQNVALPYTAVSNQPTSYSIVWNANPANTFLAVTDAALTANSISIAIPAGTAAGTYTGTLTVKNANGCISTASNFTITVNSVPTITSSGNLIPICQSSSAQVASLPYSSTTGSPINYSIDWAVLNDQVTTAFPFNSGGGNIDNINIPANAAAGTYSGVMTITTSNGCSTTQAISLIINAVPTINTAGVFTPVCQSSSAQTTTLSYNSTTGSPVSYEIDWIALTDQGATPFPFSSGSGDIINVNVPANTTAGTYNGIMTITTSNGCPATQNVSLTVNSISVAPTASVTQQPTCINNIGVITVTSPASGTGYTYSIDGLDFSNTSGIFTGLSSGAYNVQTKNSTSGCESEVTPVTINAFVTKVWNGNVDANWGNPANWTPSGVPIVSDCVDIPNVGVDPIISGTNASFFASRLTIENNGSLIVEETNSITVNNEVNVLGNGVLIFQNNSSLVQVADVNNTGNITYIRKSSIRKFDLTYWSSPVAGITMNEFSPGTLFDKYFYFTSDFKWATNLYGTMTMNAGEGYSIRGPQSFDQESPSVFTGEFVGVPNNGTIQGPTAGAEKFCLFGNPYPSAIYADEFIHDNAANFYGTLYFWTHNTSPRITVPGGNIYAYTNDDYAIYNLSGDTTIGNLTGIGAPSPGNQEPLLGYIAAGQGFFAKARTGQRGVFTNSMRVPNSNSQFYKSSKTEVVEKHRVWLNFTNTEGAFKQLLIGYITGATNSFDFNYDAGTMNANPYVDFYSINEGKKLVIQGRAVPFVVTDTIPLGYKSTIKEGAFTIAIDRTDGNLTNQDIYLQDKVTNTIHNLKSGGYTFNSAPGTFLDRFVLRYTNPNGGKPLGNEDFENKDQRIFVSVKDKNIKLQAVSELESLDEVAIYDVGGKLLYTKKQIGNKEWVIPNFQSGPQVLLVKVTLDNGNTVTRKIVFR